jgi:tripartite ATP-independent transporter DctP family solute receptor
MKKLVSIALCAVIVASLTACGGSAPAPAAAPAAEAKEETKEEAPAEEAKEEAAPAEAAAEAPADLPDASGDPKVTFVFAEVNTPDTLITKVDQKFADTVNELSGGTINIDLQHSKVLGAEGEVLDNMIGGVGTIQMARISTASLVAYGCPKAGLIALPFFFETEDHFWKFADSEISDEFLREPEEVGDGIRGLFFAEEGFRNIFTSTKVNDMDGLKGLKIRTSTDPVMVDAINALGASATVVDYTELYTSLQSGVVDGAENPMPNYLNNSFYEVAPYVIESGHQLGVVEIIITDAAWNSLTDAQKACMEEAAAVAKQYCRDAVEEANEEAVSTLKDKGVEFVEVPDKTPWIEAVQPVIEKNTKGLEDLYQAVKDLK